MPKVPSYPPHGYEFGEGTDLRTRTRALACTKYLRGFLYPCRSPVADRTIWPDCRFRPQRDRNALTVDVVLHILEYVRISKVKESDAASSDLTIDCRQTAEDDIVPHEEGILMNPIPQRVEVAGLENVGS